MCEGYVQSQINTLQKDTTAIPSDIYAQRFHSNPGKQDGLYWAVSKGEPESPLGPLVASASADHPAQAAENHVPYYGYLYRILTEQGPDAAGGAKSYIVDGKLTGGFALFAYPGGICSTGIMTFIVNQDGVIYQQDLGDQTDELASKITAYNPDSSWESAQR